MWSVWSKPVDVYLGQGIAMLKVGGAETRCVRYPPTLPLERALVRIAELAPEKIQKGSKLRMCLSSALCPPLVVPLPDSVKLWNEKHHIALAAAATEMGTHQEQISCEMAIDSPNLAAAISVSVLQQLTTWATAMGCKLVSVAPLWSLATQLKSTPREVHCVSIREPDSLTLLVHDSHGKFDAVTFPAVDEALEAKSLCQQWLDIHHAESLAPLELGFNVAPDSGVIAGLDRWQGHWYTT